MIEVTVVDDDGTGGRWIVRDHQDGTAQLIYRSCDDFGNGTTYVRATRHLLASEVRADMARRGIPADAWPA